MKKTKERLYKTINGKQGVYYPKNWENRQAIIDNFINTVNEFNKKNNTEITCIVNKGTITASNGQFAFIPYKPIEGNIVVNSKEVIVNNVHISKQDIILDDNYYNFVTVNGSKITVDKD